MSCGAGVAERLAEGWLGEAYAELAPLLAPVVVQAALQGPAWTAERLLEAEGRPGWRSVVLIVEQGLRLLLLFLFVPFAGNAGNVARFSCCRCWSARPWDGILSGTGGSKSISGRRVWRPSARRCWPTIGARALLEALSAPDGPERLLWFLVLLLLSPFYGFLTGLLGAGMTAA